jgi:hypothetical protein
MRAREVLRRITHRHVLIAGWVLFVLYCFPGYMSYDSGDQLEQARGMRPLTNWHPPVMAILWRICDWLIAGPFLMLVIQSVTLLAGMFLILRRVLSERGAAVAAVLILLSPPVICNMGVIWKDSQMAGFLMLAIAFMMDKTRGKMIAGCALLWLATAQRHNALAATLPILLLLFVWKDGLARWKRYVLAVGVWVAITVSTMLVNNALVETKEDVFASLAMNDIVGIVRFQKDYTDEQLRADTPGVPWRGEDRLVERSRKLYNPIMTWLDVCGPAGVLDYPTTADQSAAVRAAWQKMVFAHPRAYLKHRWKTFLAELRVIRKYNFYIWWNIVDTPRRADKLRHNAIHTPVQTAWMDMQVALADTPVYWAWVYFVAGIALVWPLRRDKLGLTVVLSGILCEAFLLPVAPAIDYRYSHWMVTCTIVAAVYWVAARRRARRDMTAPA